MLAFILVCFLSAASTGDEPAMSAPGSVHLSLNAVSDSGRRAQFHIDDGVPAAIIFTMNRGARIRDCSDEDYICYEAGAHFAFKAPRIPDQSLTQNACWHHEDYAFCLERRLNHVGALGDVLVIRVRYQDLAAGWIVYDTQCGVIRLPVSSHIDGPDPLIMFDTQTVAGCGLFRPQAAARMAP